MQFKKRRGIRISYNRQGLVYFACLDFSNQPKSVRIKIKDLCKKIGKEDSGILFNLLTSGKSVKQIALDNYTSETKLYQMRKAFYEAWFKKGT